MKTKLKNIISALGIVTIVFIFYKQEYKVINYPEPNFYEGIYTIEESKLDTLNDALRLAKQHFETARYQRDDFADQFSRFELATYGNIGLAQIPIEDLKSGEPEQSFLILTGFKLNLYEHVSTSYLQYHTKKDSGYLTRLKFIKYKDGDTVIHVDEKISYRYFLREGWTLIPIKGAFIKLIGNWLPKGIYMVTTTLYLFAALLFLLFLVAIYRNRAFEKKNIDRLKKISITLLILSFIPYLVSITSYLFFIYNYGGSDVTFTYSYLENDYKYLVYAILFYLLYTAFSKGMELQKEQDLTI